MFINRTYIVFLLFLSIATCTVAAVRRENQSVTYFTVFIFLIHLPLILVFVVTVYIARCVKRRKGKNKVEDVPWQVPRYWTQCERKGKTPLVDITDTSWPIKSLVYNLWQPDEVGKGRDATETEDKFIHIRKVERVQNEVLFNEYLKRKQMMERKENYIHYFKNLPEVNQDPVCTTDLIQRDRYLQGSFLEMDIDHDLNEHYLFHGTGSKDDAHSICNQGLDTAHAVPGLFGKGLYTAENPTKSDQYTGGKDMEHVLLLFRVCLGEIFVLRDEPPNKTNSKPPTSPPCSTCCKFNCNEREHKLRFDSVVTDVSGMRFREFVVYRDYRLYPEYIITYDRVSDDTEMRQYMMPK